MQVCSCHLQSMHGRRPPRKTATIMANDRLTRLSCLTCTHARGSHQSLIGFDDSGNFKTKVSQEYPDTLCRIIADSAFCDLQLAYERALGHPGLPALEAHSEPLTMPAKLRRQLDHLLTDELCTWDWKACFAVDATDHTHQ